MPEFTNVIGTASVTDAMVPDQMVDDIIKEIPKSSILMGKGRIVRMAKGVAKQPVLASLPQAYFVNESDGLVQTTDSEWKDLSIVAEDIASIVPIPLNLLDDSDVPLWEEVRPLLGQAVGATVDSAALFGKGKPESWPEAIVPAAVKAGNTVARGTGADLGVDVADLGVKLAEQGYAMNGFASKPGMQWELVALRNANGDPIYTQNLSGNNDKGLYGFPLNECDNGAWDRTQAELLGADWSKIVVGIRQDITYSIYREGVISDAAGKVVLNLMQKRYAAMMVFCRIGFQVANPVTCLGGGYPAGIVAPAAAGASKPSSAFDPEGSVPPTDKNTVAEIDAFTAAHNIDLAGKTTKAEKIAVIDEALKGGE